METSNQVTKFGHFCDRKSKRDCDSKGETFGNSDDDNGDSDDESIEHIGQVLRISDASLLVNVYLEEHPSNQSDKGKESDRSTEFTNEISNGFELCLQWSLFAFDVHDTFSTSRSGSTANSAHNCSCLSSHGQGVLEEERIWAISVVFICDVSLVKLKCLAGETRFVSGEGDGFDSKAICWDVVTCGDCDDITDNKLFSIDCHDLSITDYSCGSNILFGLEILELLFFDVIV